MEGKLLALQEGPGQAWQTAGACQAPPRTEQDVCPSVPGRCPCILLGH